MAKNKTMPYTFEFKDVSEISDIEGFGYVIEYDECPIAIKMTQVEAENITALLNGAYFNGQLSERH